MNAFTLGTPSDHRQTTTDEQLPPMEPTQTLPKVKQAPTKYVIVETSNGTDFKVILEVDASSDLAALKKAVPTPDPDLKYAAIPKRSFRLRGGTSESKPVVKFS